MILTTMLLGAAVAAAPAWALQWSPRVDASREVLGQDVRTRRQTAEIARLLNAEDKADLVYEFRDLDLPAVDDVPADTNSYVHRFTFAWHRRADKFRLRLGLTLAVSSNALKDPGDLNARDVYPAIGVGWRTGPVWLDLYADDRLGRTLAYPGFELSLQPTPSHDVRIGFPETSWRWQVAPRWSSIAAIQPDGACWQVRDELLDERRSEVCSRSWQGVWTLRWQDGPFAVSAAVGYSFASSVEYQLRDQRTVRVDVPSGGFYQLSLGARF
jgi:hypothetical protein